MFVECKWSENSTSPHLYYLKKKFPETKYYQVTAMGEKNFIGKKGILHLSAPESLRKFIWRAEISQDYPAKIIWLKDGTSVIFVIFLLKLFTGILSWFVLLFL